ncbi:MAG: DUF4268 domain-containing protein [Actinomycetota bacterium]
MNLGRLEYRSPREVWPDEARDFTPWLFDNSDALADAIGIEILIEQREHSVGPFFLDLFGEDQTHGCPLIIENQLSQTDHRHLGQLLTYAAGTDAKTIVWIAPTFRDEHRQALDFLNHISGSEARFFGVELKVAVIGDSEPAPVFTVAAQPSDWRIAVRSQRDAAIGLSARRQLYLQFWTAYFEHLMAVDVGMARGRTPQARTNQHLGSMRRGIGLGAAFFSGERFSCHVYIDAGDVSVNERIFESLRERRAEIESEIGEALQWEALPTRRACRIGAVRIGSAEDVSQRNDLIEWLTRQHAAFQRAFVPIVSGLDSSLWALDEDEFETEDEFFEEDSA